MFQKIEKLGISNFKCEILRDNSPALAIMKRFGGYQNKKLVDYRIEIQKLREEQAVCEGLTIERENGFDFLPKYNIAEGDLSWQNSVESLSGMLQDFCIITVTLEREFVGYGVINIFQGDIPQLYIAEAYRHKNIGSWLIHELVKVTQSKYTSFYGIDESRDLVNNFIIKNCFDIYSKQYELIKK